jgi:hypothetical protein
MLSVFVNKDKHLAMLQSNSIVLSVYREGINIVVKEYVYREMGQAHKERENSFTEVLPFPCCCSCRCKTALGEPKISNRYKRSLNIFFFFSWSGSD